MGLSKKRPLYFYDVVEPEIVVFSPVPLKFSSCTLTIPTFRCFGNPCVPHFPFDSLPPSEVNLSLLLDRSKFSELIIFPAFEGYVL